jgi:hypothetical protein
MLKRGAFTLIEVLLAMGMFAMVLVAIYASWSAILRGAKSGQLAAAEAQRSRITLRALREALSSTVMYTENTHLYSFLTDTTGDYAGVSFVSHLAASFPGSGLFPDHPIRRVTFSVEPGESGLNELILRQSPLLEPSEAGVEPYKIRLAPAVNWFRLEFLDTNKWEWNSEWIPTNQLPRLVRVALGFGAATRHVQRTDDVTVQTIYLNASAITRAAPFRGAFPGGRSSGILPGSGARSASNGRNESPQRGTSLRQPGLSGGGNR